MINKTDLGINFSFYYGNSDDRNHYRRMEHLKDFKTNFKEISNKEVRRYMFLSGNKIIDEYILLKIKRLHKKTLFEHKDKILENREKDVGIIGYFIEGETKWMEDIKPLLQKEIELKNKKNIIPILNKIKKEQSVSIHIRRGDLLKLKNSFILQKEYYIKAINYLDKILKKPSYYIFSDDIEWCKKNFRFLKNKKFIKNLSPSEDLELMRSCKHNILANSTFSWWAGYLNRNDKKIIIQPNYMNVFKGNSCNHLLFKNAVILNIK